MKTTLIALSTLMLASSSLAEVRYLSAASLQSAVGYGGGGGGGGGGGYGDGNGNALGGGGGGNDGYGAEQGTFSLGGGSLMRLAMPALEQSAPSYHQSGPVSAAVQTKRTVEVKPVRVPEDHVEPHVVDVEASVQPVHVVFRSSSNPIMVNQIHKPADPNKVERTESEDEPHRVQHRVTRPIIQQVHEIIQPYRKVLQEIRPVVEDIRTVVAKASDSERGGYGGNHGGNQHDPSNGYGGGAGGQVSYSDSAPSMSVLPSPLKYRSRKQHNRRLNSKKRYSRRA